MRRISERILDFFEDKLTWIWICIVGCLVGLFLFFQEWNKYAQNLESLAASVTDEASLEAAKFFQNTMASGMMLHVALVGFLILILCTLMIVFQIERTRDRLSTIDFRLWSIEDMMRARELAEENRRVMEQALARMDREHPYYRSMVEENEFLREKLMEFYMDKYGADWEEKWKEKWESRREDDGNDDGEDDPDDPDFPKGKRG
jgi:hypothetical protein